MSSLPSNNTLVFSLPPGVTPAQFEAHTIRRIIQGVVLGVLVWDYFSLIRDEIKLYQSSGNSHWKTPAAYAFVILRYAGFLATLPSLFLVSIPNNHCQLAVALSQAGVILIVASSGIIFGYRVATIWNGNKIVYALVAVVYACMVGSWLAVATQYRTANGPPTPFGSNCKIFPIVRWSPICYAASVAFDALVLILTLIKLPSPSSSSISNLIYRDSLLYFFFTTVTNTTVLVIQAQPAHTQFDQIKPMVVPFSTLVTATMGVRVFLNLRLFNRRQGVPVVVPMKSGNSGVQGRVVPYRASASECEGEDMKMAGVGYEMKTEGHRTSIIYA